MGRRSSRTSDSENGLNSLHLCRFRVQMDPTAAHRLKFISAEDPTEDDEGSPWAARINPMKSVRQSTSGFGIV